MVSFKGTRRFIPWLSRSKVDRHLLTPRQYFRPRFIPFLIPYLSHRRKSAPRPGCILGTGSAQRAASSGAAAAAGGVRGAGAGSDAFQVARPRKRQELNLMRIRGVPFGRFGWKNRWVSIPGLPGGLISSTRDIHLFPLKGHLCEGSSSKTNPKTETEVVSSWLPRKRPQTGIVSIMSSRNKWFPFKSQGGGYVCFGGKLEM